MSDLTLIIPTKSEVESLPIFLKELEGYNFAKLIVLQKEDIDTHEAISKIDNIDILVQKKKGYGNALIEGIKASLNALKNRDSGSDIAKEENDIPITSKTDPIIEGVSGLPALQDEKPPPSEAFKDFEQQMDLVRETGIQVVCSCY